MKKSKYKGKDANINEKNYLNQLLMPLPEGLLNGLEKGHIQCKKLMLSTLKKASEDYSDDLENAVTHLYKIYGLNYPYNENEILSKLISLDDREAFMCLYLSVARNQITIILSKMIEFSELLKKEKKGYAMLGRLNKTLDNKEGVTDFSRNLLSLFYNIIEVKGQSFNNIETMLELLDKKQSSIH